MNNTTDIQMNKDRLSSNLIFLGREGVWKGGEYSIKIAGPYLLRYGSEGVVSLTELLIYYSVCRTAPDTLGLSQQLA